MRSNMKQNVVCVIAIVLLVIVFSVFPNNQDETGLEDESVNLQEQEEAVANEITPSSGDSYSKTDGEIVGEKEQEAKNDETSEQFVALGFTEEEAQTMKEIFATVGITEISNIEEGVGSGIDKLQSYKCNIFDYKTSLSLHFTIDQRQLCFISLDGIPTTKTDYAYINIWGNVKFKTSNSTKSVTLYDVWDENGEIIPGAVGYKAVFNYEESKIVEYNAD